MSDSETIPNDDWMSTFRGFTETADAIARARGTLAKSAIAAAYFGSIKNSDHLETVVTWFTEGAFPANTSRRASVGSSTLAQAACAFLDIDYEAVYKPCRTATGSASETLARLLDYLGAFHSDRNPRTWSIDEVQHLFEELAQSRSRETKMVVLRKLWEQMPGKGIQYLIRVMGQGSLRIGFDARNVMNAVATAFSADPEEVRMAWMLTGSAGTAARLCAEDRLHEARFQLFQPLAFMLASPWDQDNLTEPEMYVVEEKFDGMRCQLHANADTVRLFSRDLNEITSSFPDVVTEWAAKNLDSVVLDGELCVIRDGIIRPFQDLQQRMGVKKPSKKLVEGFPIVFVAFDLLFASDKIRVNDPLFQRRIELEQLQSNYHFPIAAQQSLTDTSQVHLLFDTAISRGNEGLVLKHKNSIYEFGQRRKSWLKVKQPGGSIDTVILYATAGSGKRGGTWSDFTLAVRVDDDERFEQAWVPIGKAYGGYTNDELRQLNDTLRPLVVERFGPTVSVEPRIVVEIEFDEIQINKRTKAGYTLRFPRFRAIRWDKPLSETNTLRDVEELYETRLRRQRAASGEAVVWQ